MFYQALFDIVLLATIFPIPAYSSNPCALIGPDFPPPTKASSSISFQSAIQNLSQILEHTTSNGSISYGIPFDGANTSYSIEVFSTQESRSLLTKHHTARSVASYQYGVKKIDSNTVYRIGSGTKAISVYTFLIQTGESKLNDPITKYIPELLQASKIFNATNDQLDHVAWEYVTIRDLTSHLAGIGRDFSGLGELDGGLGAVPDAQALGLPPLNSSEVVTCAGASYCSRAQFFAGFTERHPVYAPGNAPIYSNAALQILGYVLENITGVDFEKSVQDSIFTPLKLTGSSWDVPKDNSTGIIPDGSSWPIPLGDESPAGGMFTNLNNFTAITRSILSSALLPPSTTRRWLKPRSFVSDPLAAVGAPWEIFRYFSSPNSRVVDIYTKSGDLPGYSSLMIMIPSWDLGFTVLAAGDNPTTTVSQLANMAIDTMGPAIEQAAREEANTTYSGMYTALDKSLNSSIVINTTPGKPGLGISSWISNGTDMLASLIAAPSARLYPSGLSIAGANGDTQVGFRAVYEDLTAPVLGGTFAASCHTWATVDDIYWGGVANDEFVFTVGENGIAKSVSPRILIVDLERV